MPWRRAQRRRLRLTAASQALVQKRVACLVSAACCLFASAVAWPRARLAIALAALNHMLMKGFFFVHGFATGEVSIGVHTRAKPQRSRVPDRSGLPYLRDDHAFAA